MSNNVTSAHTCDLCGAVRHERLWSLRFESYPGRFQLWRCRECGVAFNWPRLPAATIHDQYDGAYYVFSSPPARRWGRAYQLYMDHLLPLEQNTGRQRLLEVGCARGDLLQLARHRGWKVQGIEIARETAESVRQESGLPIHAGTLEDLADNIGTFDVVIATDVIEHVTSPSRFLRAIRDVLRPGGRAIIGTPNWGGMWRRLSGRRWIGLNRFHIFLFDGACLVRLMQQCGFRSCRASSGTHMAYVAWGQRPEVTRLTSYLPKALRWRVERALNRATPRSIALDLCRKPPASLDEALARISSLGNEQRARGRGRSRLTGDNLTVVARA